MSEATYDPGVDITVRTAVGSGRTLLSAFDRALLEAGVGNFNLITLSSVIPPASTVRVVGGHEPVKGGHGDRLHVVLSTAYAEHAGETVWAGLGWTTDATGGGLFVEHHAGSEASLRELVQLTLGDMVENRGGGYGPVEQASVAAHCTGRPVCALAVATYTVAGWDVP